MEGTPNAISRGVTFEFPDGKMEIPAADKSRFFTNRRFFTTAYWLDFAGDRRAVFEPRPTLLRDDHGEVSPEEPFIQ